MSALGGVVMILFGYALGAVPWGVVLGRILQSTDLRDHGSGNTGTTNAYRVLGWRVSIVKLAMRCCVPTCLWSGASREVIR